MKRLMYLVIAAAALTLGVGHGCSGRQHSPGRPRDPRSGRDRLDGGPGDPGSPGRPRDSRSPGCSRRDTGEPQAAVRPDDRAWRGVGPAPTIEPTESPLVPGDGFDWADAGIGALGAFGLGLLLVGGLLLAIRRQRPTAFS